MDYNVYCVRDEKQDLNLYGPIMLQENDGVAMRSFAHEAMKEDSIWHSHPTDFSLWCVGSYEMSCGALHAEPPRKICDAADFVSGRK